MAGRPESRRDERLSPERPRPRIRPLTAMRHMKKLIADKEDTEQVFHIINALNGRHLVGELDAFLETPAGRARLAERRDLPGLLDDHGPLKRLPEGTVGRAYVAFMEREGLTAAGLVAEYDKFSSRRYGDLVEWFANLKRDTHDLFHVLSGYGRDGLGEASLLAFTHGQSGGGRGTLFIAYMGCREARRMLPRHIDPMACFHEGRRNGKAAAKIIAEDIPALLEMPLDGARARLGIRPPTAYLRALDQIDRLDTPPGLMAAA